MPQISYLKKRGSTYYAQIAVPLELQAIIGAKTKEKSLRTKDAREAKRLLPDVLKEWHALFDQMRGASGNGAVALQPLTNVQMAMRLYRSQEQFDLEIRAVDHRYAEQGVDPGEARRLRDGFAGKLSNEELEQLVGERIERFRVLGHHNHQHGTLEWRALAQALCRAQYEAMKRQDERDEGDFSGLATDPIFQNVEPEQPSVPEGEGVLELFDRYTGENAKGVTVDTLTQGRRDVKLFVDAMDVRIADEITKKAVREWKALLLRYPVKAAEISVFRGLSMQEIVKANEKHNKPTISDKTVNRYLSALGAFCDWLVRNDYLDRNPVEGLYQFVDKTTRRKQVFSIEQLNILFSSPLFTACASEREWHKPGAVKIRDHRYWLPYVMLYSGARPAEIAQLLIEDVHERHGHWVIHITETGDDEKSVKTKGSMRTVPVHPELIRLGFVKYRNDMEQRGERRLFPNAVRNSRGQMVADFSREFGRFLIRLELKEGRGLSLYSFRHGFIDELRRNGYLDEQIAFLVGHTAHTMTGQYGHISQGNLEQRVEMISSISYPGFAPF